MNVVPVFAYGSLMAPYRRAHVRLPVRESVPAIVAGYSLEFRRPHRCATLLGGLATLTPDPLGFVHGRLHHVDRASARALDWLELVPFGVYKHLNVVVRAATGEFPALAYALVEPEDLATPRPRYLKSLLLAGRSAELPAYWEDDVLAAAQRHIVAIADRNAKLAAARTCTQRPGALPGDTRRVLPRLTPRKLRLANDPIRGALRRLTQRSLILYGAAVPAVVYRTVQTRAPLAALLRVNPTLPSGGWVMVSKYERLRPLLGRPGVLPTVLAYPGKTTSASIQAELTRHNIVYPLIAKPDTGRLGYGVRRIDDASQLRMFLTGLRTRHLVQSYSVKPKEYAVLYCRFPTYTRGAILDIAERQLPTVIGDGLCTVRDLVEVRADWSAPIKVALLHAADPALLRHRPARGEHIQLAIAARASTGALFVARPDLISEALRDYLDTLTDGYPGFHFGKVDLKASSDADVFGARDLQILEINATASEVTSAFDQRVGPISAVRAVATQLSLLTDIGSANTAYEAPSALEFARSLAVAQIHAQPAMQGNADLRTTTTLPRADAA